jgi:hypothetical protein
LRFVSNDLNLVERKKKDTNIVGISEEKERKKKKN